MVAHAETTYLAVAQTHREVGVAIVGQIHLHLYLSLAELLLLSLDGDLQRAILTNDLVVHNDDVVHGHSGGILLCSLHVFDHELLALLQQLRLLVEPLRVACEIAVELRLYRVLEESGPVLLRHLLVVVLQHGGSQFLVEGKVPLIAIVLKLHILLLRVVAALDLHAAHGPQAQSAVEEL